MLQALVGFDETSDLWLCMVKDCRKLVFSYLCYNLLFFMGIIEMIKVMSKCLFYIYLYIYGYYFWTVSDNNSFVRVQLKHANQVF